MRCRCTGIVGNEYHFIADGEEKPKAGVVYELEDAQNGTAKQNKTIHALIGEYFKAGCHPKKGGEPYDTLRDHLKLTLGAGMEKYFYGFFLPDNTMKKGETKEWADIPKACRTLYKADKAFIVGKLKSVSKYTKKERMAFIDNLIDDMTAAGVNSEKFQKIMRGLEDKA